MPTEVKWGISVLAGGGIIALGWKLPALLTVFHVIICLLLVVVVLMQSGKAADLAGAFGGAGSQTAFGPRGAANLLTRVTTWCFIMFLLTTITMSLRQQTMRPTGGSGSVFENAPSAPAQQPPAGQPAPTTPTPQPPGQQTPPAQSQPVPTTPAPQPQKPPAQPQKPRTQP